MNNIKKRESLTLFRYTSFNILSTVTTVLIFAYIETDIKNFIAIGTPIKSGYTKCNSHYCNSDKIAYESS